MSFLNRVCCVEGRSLISWSFSRSCEWHAIGRTNLIEMNEVEGGASKVPRRGWRGLSNQGKLEGGLCVIPTFPQSKPYNLSLKFSLEMVPVPAIFALGNPTWTRRGI